MSAKKSEAKNLPALTTGRLSSAEMSTHLKVDVAMFNEVKLDVLENEELFKNDFIIPKLWLIQAMSELRKQKKATEGDYCDSQTGEVLCSENEFLNVVVLKTFKRWHTFELLKDKKEFISSEIMVMGKNENLPYEETIEGKSIVRRQVISAYCLLERDVKLGLNKPYIIDFYSSSKGAGRKLISDIKTLNVNKYPSFVAFFKLGSKIETFGDGDDAFVKTIDSGGYITDRAVMPFLIDCYKNLITLQDQIEIDDRDVIKGQAVETNIKNSKSKLSKDLGAI